MVKHDFPTPPPPTTTSLYSRRNCGAVSKRDRGGVQVGGRGRDAPWMPLCVCRITVITTSLGEDCENQRGGSAALGTASRALLRPNEEAGNERSRVCGWWVGGDQGREAVGGQRSRCGWSGTIEERAAMRGVVLGRWEDRLGEQTSAEDGAGSRSARNKTTSSLSLGLRALIRSNLRLLALCRKRPQLPTKSSPKPDRAGPHDGMRVSGRASALGCGREWARCGGGGGGGGGPVQGRGRPAASRSRTATATPAATSTRATPATATRSISDQHCVLAQGLHKRNAHALTPATPRPGG
jgi:hypothetical protein